jgi:hypothetical protein
MTLMASEFDPQNLGKTATANPRQVREARQSRTFQEQTQVESGEFTTPTIDQNDNSSLAAATTTFFAQHRTSM